MFGLCINYKVQGSPHESHTLKAKKLYDFQTLSQRWSKQQIVVMNDWGKEFFLLLCCNLFGKNFVSTVHALVFLGHRTKHVNACQHLHYVTMCELSSWPIVRELMKVAVRPWSKVRASYKVIKKPALYCGGSLCFWLLFRKHNLVMCTSVLTRRNLPVLKVIFILRNDVAVLYYTR